jgi:hypothetical protein
MSDDPPLPTFVIIGAQKSGTRWLRYNLGLHPDVFAPDTEPNFFIDERADAPDGLAWYQEQFAGWDGEPIVGEATPAYMIRHHDPARCADRIQRWIPDVRLLAILRNPVDRLCSAVVHHVRKGRLAPGTDPLVLLERDERELFERPLSLVEGGRYAESLEPYLDRFGDQLLVVLNDDLIQPEAVYERALAHIGARPHAPPPGLGEVRFSNAAAGRAPALSPTERARLYELYADDIDRLEVLIGRDLSGWRPGGVSSD